MISALKSKLDASLTRVYCAVAAQWEREKHWSPAKLWGVRIAGAVFALVMLWVFDVRCQLCADVRTGLNAVGVRL